MRLGAAIAIAVALAIVAWLLVRSRDDESATNLTTPSQTLTTARSVPVGPETLKSSTEPNTVRVDTGAGAVAFHRSAFEKNVYVSFDGSDVQIEVFGPVAGKPASLVSSGQIVPVG